MQFSKSTGDFSSMEDFQELLQFRGTGSLVFSVFLNLAGSATGTGGLVKRFDQLLETARQQKKLDQASEQYRKQWTQEADRIRQWLSTSPGLRDGSLALFSCQPEGLWQVYHLPLPCSERIEVSDRPYTRPVEVMQAEIGCTLVILIGSGSARIVRMSLGMAAEVDVLQAMPVTGQIDESSSHQYAQAVAEQAARFWQEQKCDRLVIGGVDETLNELRDALTTQLHDRLVKEIHLSPEVDITEVAAAVTEIEADQADFLEMERVQELIQSAGDEHRAVLGPEQSLLAVRDRKARLLIVDEAYHPAGGECPNCGFMTVGDGTTCLLCSMALRPEPDIMEAALKHVLDHNGEIEIVRSEQARLMLEPHAQIGALLHQAQHHTVRDSANQLPIEKDGQIYQDIRYDETIEESFPASDPPAY